MNETAFKYCPACGSQQFTLQSDKSHQCGACQFKFYVNTATAVVAIITVKDKILLVKRRHNPGKGLFDLPGGFAEHGETAEQALARELKEELDFTNNSPEYLCSYPNIYPYAGYTYHTVDLFYLIRLDHEPDLTPADDVSDFIWVNRDDIHLYDFAFESVINALKHYKQSK